MRESHDSTARAVPEGHASTEAQAVPEGGPNMARAMSTDTQNEHGESYVSDAFENTIVVVLDWFAPHLDEAVDDTIWAACNTPLKIGGGITPDVQTPDTHRHGPYTREYRELEATEAQEQLSLRPHQLPSSSRQTVMARAMTAWKAIDHDSGEQEWIENACLNALDGSEDGEIRSDLQSVWRELHMAECRENIKKENQRCHG